MKIAIGSNGGSRAFLNEIARHLEGRGFEVADMTDGGVGFAAKASEAVMRGDADVAVLADNSGALSALIANKTPGVRAAQVGDFYSARLTKAHNDANVLCMGSKIIGIETAISCVDIWLDTIVMGGNHPKRIAMITDIERTYGR